MSQVSPLCATRFALELQQHPNQALVSEVLQGLLQGFRLGFNPGFSLRSAKKNKASAYQHPEIVDAYLANEVALGRVAGPFHSPPLPNLHINSFGVIPKKGQPNKWRLILDMSSPLGSSVNEGINPNDYPLQYIRVDDIIKMVSKFGQGALMAKFDVEAAYRNLAVHPTDRYLIGMKWRSMFYVDLALPFGLRSAPYIFNSVADLVEWILLNNYHLPDLLHYLDDFITAGPPNSPQCENNLSTASSVCATLGLPLHPSKKVGPTTCMVTLGIELDSVNQLARLPNDKLTSLLNLLHRWSSYRWCTKRQLQSLIGHLHHAAKVVWPGRAFIRRMINLLHNFRRDDHPIQLSAEFKKDLRWWLQYLASWNGVCFWVYPGLSPPIDLEMASDASGSFGFGAVFRTHWLYGKWPSALQSASIEYKELFPIVVAAHVWGSSWFKQVVLFHCDNESVVFILNSRTSRAPDVMHLLRLLLMAAAHHNFIFSAQHIAGSANKIPDAISRFHWQAFRHLAPQADRQPTVIPPHLWETLTFQA